MKRIKGLLVMLVMLMTAWSVSSPQMVYAKAIKVTANSKFKKIPVVKANKKYKVLSKNWHVTEKSQRVSFQAPKDGTYVFTLSNIRSEGHTAKEETGYAWFGFESYNKSSKGFEQRVIKNYESNGYLIGRLRMESPGFQYKYVLPIKMSKGEVLYLNLGSISGTDDIEAGTYCNLKIKKQKEA